MLIQNLYMNLEGMKIGSIFVMLLTFKTLVRVPFAHLSGPTWSFQVKNLNVWYFFSFSSSPS